MRERTIRPIHRRAFLEASLSATALAAGWPFASLGQANTLRDAAAPRKLLAGSALSNRQLHNPAIAGMATAQCAIVVPENEMKWDAVHPERDRYDFTAADELAAFAEKNSLLLRGHNLCWHDAQPPWLAAVATAENAAELLEEHIRTVAGRYAGRIHSWDVVNEAIAPQDGRSDGLRNTSLWFKLLGKEYIAVAFRAAAAADPKALLTYNDYGLEEPGSDNEDRRDATLRLLRWMRSNQIPIHALGLQSHIIARYDELPDWSGMDHFLKEVAKLDLKIFVTELDIDDNNLDGRIAERQKEVAWLCRNYLENVLKHPQVEAVLTWGLLSHGTYGDGRPDLGHRALPFDEHLEPSPFLAAMLGAFQKR